MPKTAAEKKRDERQRRKDAGLMRLEIWIRPAWRKKILDFLKKLENK